GGRVGDGGGVEGEGEGALAPPGEQQGHGGAAWGWGEAPHLLDAGAGDVGFAAEGDDVADLDVAAAAEASGHRHQGARRELIHAGEYQVERGGREGGSGLFEAGGEGSAERLRVLSVERGGELAAVEAVAAARSGAGGGQGDGGGDVGDGDAVDVVVLADSGG